MERTVEISKEQHHGVKEALQKLWKNVDDENEMPFDDVFIEYIVDVVKNVIVEASDKASMEFDTIVDILMGYIPNNSINVDLILSTVHSIADMIESPLTTNIIIEKSIENLILDVDSSIAPTLLDNNDSSSKKKKRRNSICNSDINDAISSTSSASNVVAIFADAFPGASETFLHNVVTRNGGDTDASIEYLLTLDIESMQRESRLAEQDCLRQQQQQRHINDAISSTSSASNVVAIFADAFPGASETFLHNVVTRNGGDTDASIEYLLTLDIESMQRESRLAEQDCLRQQQQQQAVKSRLIDRYSIVEQLDGTDIITKCEVPKPCSAPKKMLRYRDGEVVSTKGEKFQQPKKKTYTPAGSNLILSGSR